jgi:S-adenosylmethionine synthetase
MCSDRSHHFPVDGLFTSESVSDGHPDKICDLISDAILDACLAQDPFSRVAIEVAIKSNLLVILGEVTTEAEVDFQMVGRNVLGDIGHANGAWGLDPKTFTVVVSVSPQSPNIARGIDGENTGAGDQGLMFGFACDETPEFMPLPITLAHALMRRHKDLRSGPGGEGLGPDAKSQVTVRYAGGRPKSVETVVLSTQHSPELSNERLREYAIEEIIKPTIPKSLLGNARFLVNPTGEFLIGGPLADAGLTGRKIIVDTYGGYARHGGGAFSGKDPTKVDRSAAYAARQIARDIVFRQEASTCEIRVAYAIGVAEPVAIDVETFGTSNIPDGDILRVLYGEDFAGLLRPSSILDRLDLRRPLYQKTAAFGHFGRTEFPWEQSVLEGEPGVS